MPWYVLVLIIAAAMVSGAGMFFIGVWVWFVWSETHPNGRVRDRRNEDEDT